MASEGGAAEDVKPKVDPDAAADAIQVVVKDQDGGVVQFKVKSTTKFIKIFKAYCQKKALDMAAVRFIFDGLRITENSTPADIGLENEDVIEAMQEQVGGDHH